MTHIDVPAPGGLSFPDPGGPEVYAELLRTARATGRCPIWCAGSERFGGMPVPPDVSGAITTVDPYDVLSRWWPEGCPCLAPFTGAFPGLTRADGVDRSTRPETTAKAISVGTAGGGCAVLGVVDACRPADIPAALGWSGTCNYGDLGDLVSIGAVLRSWEERFGAVLVRIDGSRLWVAVADPPTTQEESERVAAEHFAFCPDQVDPQIGPEPFTLVSYARTIRRAPVWRFWWD